MELTLSDNALKTFARCITCLARIGNELAIQASSSQLIFHTINSSRSAYQCIAFKPGFFDAYTVSSNPVQCSVLLKAVCAVLRTPITNIDHLTVRLPDPDAPKVQWILDCYNGMRKTYWITCNVEPEIQHLSLDRQKFPSNFVVRPRDLNRLLANFQSSLQEITIIATEPSSLPPDAANEIGGKAVELRSYMDPTKGKEDAFVGSFVANCIFMHEDFMADNDTLLHTQLWIDPKEEFLQYDHTGDPIDVTFSVKELKAFLSFCEGCEVDIHLHFEKAGEPILMAPKFGLEDGSHSNFDATLVLATMLITQLHEGAASEPPVGATRTHPHNEERNASHMQQENCRTNASEPPSDHTRIWSDLSASAFKSVSALEERQAQGETILNNDGQREIQRISTMQISRVTSVAGNNPIDSNFFQPTEKDHGQEPQDEMRDNDQAISQHHPSNWVEAEEDDEDEQDENEQYIQSTPPYYEEH
ncbi:Cell cycle checkpoint control protein RAD9A [Spatholobus suberectus]|nr:Cell cycle checkpoint control protein RAD9A [Spatholobus suberectus]